MWITELAVAAVLTQSPPSPTIVPYRPLMNPTPVAADAFGQSIAYDGRTIVVGSPGTFSFPLPGEVHVFAEGPLGRWFLTETLTVEAEGVVEGFGNQVALDADRLAVQGSIDGIGHVFLFQRTSLGRWIEIARATPTDVLYVACEPFRDLALCGSTLLVGNDPDDEYGPFASAVHVFDTSSGLVEVQKLVPADVADFDHFGESLALENDTAVISSFVDNPSGSVYVFRKTPGGWVEHQKLWNPDPSLFWFGWSVDIQRDRIVVGVPDCPDTGGGACRGAVFVYEEDDAGRFERVARIDAGLPPPLGVMGQAIALDGDRLYVRSRRDSVGTLAGGLRVYDRAPDGAWFERAFLSSPLEPLGEGFAWSLAAADGRVAASVLGDFKHCYQALGPGRAVVLSVPLPARD